MHAPQGSGCAWLQAPLLSELADGSGATDDASGPLTNFRDELFPWSSMQTLTRIPHQDYGHYGLDKMWEWLLKFHGMPLEIPPPKAGETCGSLSLCCSAW